MAFGAWIQGTSKDAGTASSATLAYGSNVTAGNTLVIAVRAGTGEGTISVSDNLNGSWTSDDGPFSVTSAGDMQHFRFSNTAGGACTVTVTFGTAKSMRFLIDEYTGNFALDGATHSQGSSTSLSSGSITTTHTCAVLGWGITAHANASVGQTFSAGSGFTLRESIADAVNNEMIVANEDMGSTQSAGSQSATMTISGSDNWGMGVLGYFDANATTAPLPPQVTPAELVLAQYGLDAAFQQQWANAGAPMTSWAGSGNLDFEASGTFAQTAYSKPPQVTPAEIVLAQYGFDSVYLATPNAGAPMAQWSGSGNLDFEASATFTQTAYSVPPQVLPAELILAQYGLDSVYLTTLRAGAPMAQWAGSGNLDFEASASFTLGAPSVLPSVLPAEIVLAQYGLDSVYLTTLNAGGTITNWTGTGNLDFEASATFTETAYSVPPVVEAAELILQQYGLDGVFLTTPNAGAPMAQFGGTGNLDFEASGTFYQSAYSVPPQIQVAQLILQQYGVDSTLLVTPNAGAPMAQLAGSGNLDFEASATFTLIVATPAGPQVLPAELILAQYGLDSVFVLLGPSRAAAGPSTLPGLVKPAAVAGKISPTGVFGLVAPKEVAGSG